MNEARKAKRPGLMSIPKEELFWHYVDKIDSESECWSWIGGRNRHGYGVFRTKGSNILAHRYSYQLAYGEIPGGMFICHHCDNRPCIRPSHLFVGTHADNMKDMMSKGRKKGLKGSKNANAKLTESQVVEIRKDADDLNLSEMASKYSVSRDTIADILSRKTWNHI